MKKPSKWAWKGPLIQHPIKPAPNRTWRMQPATSKSCRQFTCGVVHLWFNFQPDGKCEMSWTIRTGKNELDKPAAIRGKRILSPADFKKMFTQPGQKYITRAIRFDVHEAFIPLMIEFQKSQ